MPDIVYLGLFLALPVLMNYAIEMLKAHISNKRAEALAQASAKSEASSDEDRIAKTRRERNTRGEGVSAAATAPTVVATPTPDTYDVPEAAFAGIDLSSRGFDYSEFRSDDSTRTSP